MNGGANVLCRTTIDLERIATGKRNLNAEKNLKNFTGVSHLIRITCLISCFLRKRSKKKL